MMRRGLILTAAVVLLVAGPALGGSITFAYALSPNGGWSSSSVVTGAPANDDYTGIGADNPNQVALKKGFIAPGARNFVFDVTDTDVNNETEYFFTGYHYKVVLGIFLHLEGYLS